MPTPEEQNNMDAVNAAFGGGTPAVVEQVAEPIINNEPPAPIINEPAKVVQQAVKETKAEKSAREEEERGQQYLSKFIEKKTEGKFKTFADYESELSKPKEVIKEVTKDYDEDENIARWIQMNRNGIKITPELLALETTDFDKMDAMQLHIENARLDEKNKKYPDNILSAKIKNQYGMKDWFDEEGQPIEDAYLSEEAKINKELFNLDAQSNKESLNKYKSERIVFQKPDEAKLLEMSNKKKADQESWEKFVDKELDAKTDKFSTEVEDEETKEKFKFDFSISDDVKKEATQMMKQIRNGSYFNSYSTKGADGKISFNDAKVYQDYVKARDFDKAMAASLKQGIALGKLEQEKRMKNTDWKPNSDTIIKSDEKKSAQEKVQGIPTNTFY